VYKIDKIYLDLDGVCCDFSKRYEELYDVTPKEANDQKMFGEYFDHFIHTGQFASLDPMEDADTLLKGLDITGIPVTILSSTAYEKVHKEISYQKEFWLSDNGIKYPYIFVPGKRLKSQYANPNSILIDDTESNINDWNNAGGIGILHKNAISTLKDLSAILGR
jgi:hypothetical protein